MRRSDILAWYDSSRIGRHGPHVLRMGPQSQPLRKVSGGQLLCCLGSIDNLGYGRARVAAIVGRKVVTMESEGDLRSVSARGRE
jgi:hypothetical protein